MLAFVLKIGIRIILKGGEYFMAENKRGLASADERTREQVARKGGQAVSQDRQHMSEIGKKGGQSVSQDRKHMSEIGRKGGQASHSGGRQSNQ